MLSMTLAGKALAATTHPAQHGLDQFGHTGIGGGSLDDGDGDTDIDELASLLGLGAQENLRALFNHVPSLNDSAPTLLVSDATRLLEQSSPGEGPSPLQAGLGSEVGFPAFDAFADQQDEQNAPLETLGDLAAKRQKADQAASALAQSNALTANGDALAAPGFSRLPRSSEGASYESQVTDGQRGRASVSLEQLGSISTKATTDHTLTLKAAMEPRSRGVTNRFAATEAEMRTEDVLTKAGQGNSAAMAADQSPMVEGFALTSYQDKGVLAPASSNIEGPAPDLQSSFEMLEPINQESTRLDSGVTAGPKQAHQPTPPPNTQIAFQVAKGAAEGVDRFSIQLHPTELGSVEVQLNFAEDGHVSALIVAERAETLDMLQKDSRALERSLASAGLQLDSGGLSFSLKQDQNTGGQGSNGSGFEQAKTSGDDEAYVDNPDHRPEQNLALSQHRLLDIRT